MLAYTKGFTDTVYFTLNLLAMRLLYTLLIYLFSPVILFFLYRPKKGKPGFESRWKEHLGFVPLPRNQDPVWIHAVSVGETLAITPFIQAFKKQHPDTPIILTTTTRTGADQAQKLGELIEHRYAPLDYPDVLSRFFSRIQPRMLIIMETELWPNLLNQCHNRSIPVVIMNARLSERSCQRYQHIRSFFASMSQAIKLLLCQHQDDAARFVRLGVSPENIQVTGSVKFDIHLNQDQIEQSSKDRKFLKGRPVWIAASTHKGEDELILQAHRKILTLYPNALLILVPRHPERFTAVAELCIAEKFTMCRRSDAITGLSVNQILLGDSMGEMAYYFQLADIAFMGGSFVTVGGHNLLEPAALAKPTLIGPHFFNFTDITNQLVDKKACFIVENQEALADRIIELLKNPELQHDMGMAGFDVVTANQGALDKSLKAVESLLHR